MDVVDLFCGGGGSSTGLHQAGFSTIYAIDHSWHCIKTFRANHGDVVHGGDIEDLRSEQIQKYLDGKPTIVTASPPCEPFTSANVKRIGDPFSRLFDDPIGRLMIDAIRLIADLDPDFYFIENVRGILDGDNKNLLRDEIIDQGLGNPCFNWIAAPSWGIPSERTRVIISNISLSSPNIGFKTVRDAISNLPPPNHPTGLEYHYTIPVSSQQFHEMSTLGPGQGLVYFYGSNQEYQNYIRLAYDQPAPVVMGKSRFVHPVQDRLLTPLEHSRLMTFPDNYDYLGTTEQVYDMIGEAVPPKIMTHIGHQVKKLL